MKAHNPQIDLPEMEKKILDCWESEQTFYKSNEIRRDGGKEYTFYDGPPFANGLPHYGHMLGQTLKDTVPRYWNMRGFYVERRFGWDCHGLPVEFEVEKKNKLNGRKDILAMGVDKFNEECRKTVFHYAGEWKKTITRLGRWVDWNNQYRTMDLSFMETVWWVLKQLHDKGLLYKDLKIVSYSPRITAVVSNFEANLNYKDVQDPAITVKFKLTDEDAYLLAWTTTPWTLVSNLALVVGGEVGYVKVKDLESNQHYYLSKDSLSLVYKKQKGKPQAYEIVSEHKASELVGRTYEPLFPYFAAQQNAFKVLEDPYVTSDSGTGIVHSAPAFGEDDFRVCRKAGINIVDPLDDEARYTDVVPEYKGQFVKDADKNIIKDLKTADKLLRHETIVHSYAHCDRTEGPLIYRAIPTWYVAVEKFREHLVENNKTINWVPNHLRDGRMGRWLENARDWAISRNRFWGTPIPVWVCDQDEKCIEVIGSISELEERADVKIDDLHKHHIDNIEFKCKKCSGTMRRIPEVFDCWFESGSMPYAQKHYPFENEAEFKANFPADFIAEGQDQTRGWFYTLSILSGALFQKPAFKNVVVNGIVLAADGKKMSKRLGNYTPPDILLDKFGSDSVRLYMLNSAVLRGEDLKFSDEGVRDTTRAVLLPLWNAFSFLSTYAEAEGWQPKVDLLQNPPAATHELDRWILSRLQTLKKGVHEEMELYRIYLVVPKVLAFIEDLTNWYIRLSRRRFWSDEKTPESLSAYETLFYVTTEFCKVFAPFAPFIADHIYRSLSEGLTEAKSSVHLTDMPLVQNDLVDEALEAKMSLLRRATNLGRSLRAKHQIKTRQVLPSLLIITRKESDSQFIKDGETILKEELNVKGVEFSTDEARFVKLGLKPNLKALGPRLGKELGKVRNHLMDLSKNAEKVASLLGELDSAGEVEVCGYQLTEADFLIDRGPKDDRLIATERGVTVLLDTTLTEELILEGLSRELVNRVQKLRKDSGLNVSDRINLRVSAPDKLSDAINAHRDYVSGETLAVSLDIDTVDNVKTAAHSGDFDIEGMACSIGISIQS